MELFIYLLTYSLIRSLIYQLYREWQKGHNKKVKTKELVVDAFQTPLFVIHKTCQTALMSSKLDAGLHVCALVHVCTFACVCLTKMQRSAPLTNTSLLRSCRLCSAETFAGQTAATANNEKQLCAGMISPKYRGWDCLKL